MAANSVAVTGFVSALKSMRDRRFLRTPKYEEQQWRAVRKGAHGSLLLFEYKFVRRCWKLGIPIFAHTVVRSNEQQAIEYADGDSRAKPGESAHNYGMAVDIVHGLKAWALTDYEWQMLGHIGSEVAAQNCLPVQWLGESYFPDPAHWQIRNWRDQIARFPFPEGD